LGKGGEYSMPIALRRPFTSPFADAFFFFPISSDGRFYSFILFSLFWRGINLYPCPFPFFLPTPHISEGAAYMQVSTVDFPFFSFGPQLCLARDMEASSRLHFSMRRFFPPFLQQEGLNQTFFFRATGRHPARHIFFFRSSM